jgi:hypothetical protein
MPYGSFMSFPVTGTTSTGDRNFSQNAARFVDDLTEIWFGISFLMLCAENTARAREETGVFIS